MKQKKRYHCELSLEDGAKEKKGGAEYDVFGAYNKNFYPVGINKNNPFGLSILT